MDSEKLRVAREKLTCVFRYLEALNQHRNPAKRQLREQPWSLGMRELPDHPCVQRGAAKVGTSKDNNFQTVEEPSYVLKVRRPRLTRPPDPPQEISAWLEDGWDDPWNSVAIEETQKTPKTAHEHGL